MIDDDEQFTLLHDPYAMLRALIVYAPEKHLRYGMLQWLLYVQQFDDGEYDESDPLDVLAQFIVHGYAILKPNGDDEVVDNPLTREYVEEQIKKLWEGRGEDGRQEDS